MAFRDYIICGECETKIIYDGYDNGRDRLEELWGDPKADFWTVHLLCPDCLKKLRAERDEALADAARYRWLRAERDEARADALALAAERNNWQSMYQDAMAERDEARALLRESNEMLAEAIVCGPKLRKYMPLRSRINATLKGDAK